MPTYFKDPATGQVMYDNGNGTASPVHGFSLGGMVPGAALDPGVQQPEPWGPDPATDAPDVTDPSMLRFAPDDLSQPMAGETPAPPPGPPQVGGAQIPTDADLDVVMGDTPGDQPGELGSDQPLPKAPPPEGPIDPYAGPAGPDVWTQRQKQLERRGEFAIQRAKDNAEAMKQEMARREKALVGRQDEIEQHQREAEFQIEQLNTHREDFLKMKVDPKKLFKDAGTLGTLAMGVGVLLSGFDAPFRGGRNMAMEMIERGVQREMKAQQANINTARVALGMEKDLLGMNLKRYKDKEVATLQTEMMVRDQFIQRLRAIAMEQPAEAKLKIEEGITQLEQAKGMAQAKLYERLTKQRMAAAKERRESLKLASEHMNRIAVEKGKNERFNAQQRMELYKLRLKGGGKADPGSAELKKLKLKNALEEQKAIAKGLKFPVANNWISLPDGTKVIGALTAPDAIAARDRLAGLEISHKKVQEILAIMEHLERKGDKRLVPGSKMRIQLDAEIAKLMTNLMETSKGVLSDKDMIQYQRQVPQDPTKYTDIRSWEGMLGQLKSFGDDLAKKGDRLVYGLTKGKGRWVPQKQAFDFAKYVPSAAGTDTPAALRSIDLKDKRSLAKVVAATKAIEQAIPTMNQAELGTNLKAAEAKLAELRKGLLDKSISRINNPRRELQSVVDKLRKAHDLSKLGKPPAYDLAAQRKWIDKRSRVGLPEYPLPKGPPQVR